MSHESGCLCNGWGGCYASCTCTEIIQRRHTVALEENTEALRRAKNACEYGSNEPDPMEAVLQMLSDLEARVRSLEDGRGKP